jgi:hypothetical protein
MRQPPPRAFAVLLGLFLAGCQAVHEVKVDAINDPAAGKGVAYRLEVKTPPAPAKANADVARYVRAALAARGYYEAPEGVLAEQVIVVEYGVGPARLAYVYKPRDMLTIDLWGKAPPKGGAVPVQVREKYLRLTARSVALPAAHGSASEAWSVNLVVEDEGKDYAEFLPALATVLAGYAGEHAAAETSVKIKEGDARRSIDALARN